MASSTRRKINIKCGNISVQSVWSRRQCDDKFRSMTHHKHKVDREDHVFDASHAHVEVVSTFGQHHFDLQRNKVEITSRAAFPNDAVIKLKFDSCRALVCVPRYLITQIARDKANNTINTVRMIRLDIGNK